MILITGPGRSGTSVLAQIYKDLGFDPGGEWVADIHGGLEPADVVAANEDILEAIGLTPMGAPGGARGRFRRAGKLLIPAAHRARARAVLSRLPWMGRSQPAMLHWERVDEVASRFRPRLHELARKYPVAKDPRFLWTMGVWLRAATPIDYAVISIRNIEATAESRVRMDSVRFTSQSGIYNSIVYGLGLTVQSLTEHDVPHAIVRFPDFLRRPADYYPKFRFPSAVSEDAFVASINRVARPDLIHDKR